MRRSAHEFMDLHRRRRAERTADEQLQRWLERRWCFMQSALSIPNEAGASFRADNNTALQANATFQSGASAPATTYAHQFWADTTTNTLKKRNAANSAWLVIRTLDESFVLSRSINTQLGLSDVLKSIRATATFTQTFAAVATLGDGWVIDYRIESGATITFDPNAAELIDGAATKVVAGPSSGRLWCDGAALYSTGFVTTTGQSRGALSGLKLSNNATATKLDVAAGKCRDSTDANDIILSSAITAGFIQISGAWAAGSTQNKLDTGARANSTWYAVHAIYKDNVADDWLFSLSATAPTLPANYTKFRRIGWAKTDGSGNIVAFTQYGDLFEWVTPVKDVDASNPGSLAVTRTLTLPSMAGITAWVMALYVSGTTNDSLYLSDLAATDSAPDRITFFSLAQGVANNWAAGDFYVPTNGSAQIRSRAEVGTSATERVSTKGWLDLRGMDA